MPVPTGPRHTTSASTSPVAMEISHAGKEAPRMFTDGESAPRHTSHVSAVRCQRRGCATPLVLPPRASRKHPGPFVVNRPVRLVARSAKAGDETARIREVSRRPLTLEDSQGDRGVRERLVPLPGDTEDVRQHEAHPRIVGIERDGVL